MALAIGEYPRVLESGRQDLVSLVSGVPPDVTHCDLRQAVEAGGRSEYDGNVSYTCMTFSVII